MEQTTNNKIEELSEVPTEEVIPSTSAYVEKSSMPKTRNLMIMQNATKRTNKYQSRNVKQNNIKRKKIMKRQQKLISIGWSLFFF